MGVFFAMLGARQRAGRPNRGRIALTLFREEAWRHGLARKLQIFRDTYAMLNDEAQTARGNVLEVIIILLIVTEVVLGFLRR